MRAIYDYAEQLDEYLAWTIGVPNLLNPSIAATWNVDRCYLADPGNRGGSTVSAKVLAPGDQVRWPGPGAVFVSPTVGTGTWCCNDRSAVATYVAELSQGGPTPFSCRRRVGRRNGTDLHQW